MTPKGAFSSGGARAAESPAKVAPESPCLACQGCLAARMRPSHSCYHTLPRAINPTYIHPPKHSFSLRKILFAITPKEIRSAWLSRLSKEKFQRIRKLLERPKVQAKHRLLKRISHTNTPWFLCKKDVPPTKQYTLESPSPRIMTAIHHGTAALLRPIIPELPGTPPSDFCLNPTEDAQLLERLDAIVAEERATRLAKPYRQIGNRTLKSIQHLKPIEIPKELEELEPLRAMSLKEVTNMKLLEANSEEED